MAPIRIAWVLRSRNAIHTAQAALCRPLRSRSCQSLVSLATLPVGRPKLRAACRCHPRERRPPGHVGTILRLYWRHLAAPQHSATRKRALARADSMRTMAFLPPLLRHTPSLRLTHALVLALHSDRWAGGIRAGPNKRVGSPCCFFKECLGSFKQSIIHSIDEQQIQCLCSEYEIKQYLGVGAAYEIGVQLCTIASRGTQTTPRWTRNLRTLRRRARIGSWFAGNDRVDEHVQESEEVESSGARKRNEI
ncbi:hypothetical protein OH77DRAFT_543316 [Trametes cingulata]|nr:hypothetical protein OH77DRAFT_543316 [Trametes cingulata]